MNESAYKILRGTFSPWLQEYICWWKYSSVCAYIQATHIYYLSIYEPIADVADTTVKNPIQTQHLFIMSNFILITFLLDMNTSKVYPTVSAFKLNFALSFSVVCDKIHLILINIWIGVFHVTLYTSPFCFNFELIWFLCELIFPYFFFGCALVHRFFESHKRRRKPWWPQNCFVHEKDTTR